ncbi:MAG: prolyl oligopeptidase family serine peptidase [Candidatus Eremiobacteraeota bacterium]|nr:prolyl oligopeptidase family serine peptidase [Candidatus Eremiobacteraeota bacterium]
MLEQTKSKVKKDISRAITRVKGFDNPEMDFQLIRSMGASYYGGGTVGECLSVASRIKDGDPDSWSGEFGELGKTVEDEGKKCFEKGHNISARDQYLRACNYFRAAEYYADFESPMKNKWGMKSRECFLKYLEQTGYYYEDLRIPFEETPMPAYFISPDDTGKKRKTIIIISGFDGTAEESFLQGGKAGLERGYNVLLLECPGQAGMRRFCPDSFFRPDFEVPVGEAIDFILERPEIDPDRLALYGLSFGGYFTSRATAYDSRVKALIANSPVIDLYRYMASFVGEDNIDQMKDLTLEYIPQIPDEIMPPVYKNSVSNMLRRFDRNNVGEMFSYMKEFRIGDSIKNINCPALAMLGEGEGGEPLRQSGKFCENVAGPVTMYKFTVKQGADSHCQVSNMPFSCAVLFDWLDELFDRI